MGRLTANPGVIALVPDHWNGIVTVRHQVLRRLARVMPVIWLNPAASWGDSRAPLMTRLFDSWEVPSPGLHVLTPGLRHPTVYRSKSLARMFVRSRLRAAKRRLESLGCNKFSLYLWRDEFMSALRLAEVDFTCYHIDDEYSFSEKEIPISEREQRILETVDQVVIHSPGLLEKKGRINPRTSFIPNGVDYAKFSTPMECPADLGNIPKPVLGYAGVIKKQLDLALFVAIAKARPNYSLVLVGPVMNVSGRENQLESLKSLPNVYILGERPAELLPSYVQHFNVCLMCYEMNSYTQYIYPLKLNEYLATGRPVVSTPIATIVTTHPPVLTASSLEEWLVAIDQSLAPEAMSPSLVELRQSVASQHDWDLLVNKIAKLFIDGMTGIRK
jgi:glycosyltransferase involved in cell wall biosynthesis